MVVICHLIHTSSCVHLYLCTHIHSRIHIHIHYTHKRTNIASLCSTPNMYICLKGKCCRRFFSESKSLWGHVALYIQCIVEWCKQSPISDSCKCPIDFSSLELCQDHEPSCHIAYNKYYIDCYCGKAETKTHTTRPGESTKL